MPDPALPLRASVEDEVSRPEPSIDARRDLSELLNRVGEGEVAAFEDLYGRTAARVYGVVTRVTRNRALSEETVQDVYVHLWSAAHTFNPSLGSPIGWIVTIAHRRAIDTVRREQRFRERGANYSLQADQSDDPVSGLIDRIAAAESLAQGWRELTELQREAIQLAYYGGLTGVEISATLGVKVSTVKTRIRDGMRRLRRCLTDECAREEMA